MKKLTYTYYTVKTNGAGYMTPVTVYAETREEAEQIYRDAECADAPIRHTVSSPDKIEHAQMEIAYRKHRLAEHDRMYGKLD